MPTSQKYLINQIDLMAIIAELRRVLADDIVGFITNLGRIYKVLILEDNLVTHKKTNPFNHYGKVTHCAVFQSTYHGAKYCSHNV